MAPASRIQEWTDKRVFFLTPQVLTNDLSRGACPADQIKCLVLDEAHRALGNHAYCQVGCIDYFYDFAFERANHGVACFNAEVQMNIMYFFL